MIKQLCLTGVLLALGGCRSFPSVDLPPDPLLNYRSTLANPDAAAKKVELDKDMQSALGFCKNVLNYYEKNATYSSRALTGIAVVGAFAGGVVVPALSAQATLSKSAIAAWGGVSGLANTAQNTVVGNNLGPDSFVGSRAKIMVSVQGVMESYFKEDSADKRAELVLRMYSTCISNDIVTGT
ncbi:MAG: hypothetical protein LWW92_08155 [Rhodocyclales bacterium]|nr:hypothetical protein [Rhodocyclales bacterium]